MQHVTLLRLFGIVLFICFVATFADAQSSCPDPDNYSTVCTAGDCSGGSGDCSFTTTFATVFTGNNKYANISIFANGNQVLNTCIGPLSNGTTSYSVNYTAPCNATITGSYIAYTNSSQQNPCGGTSCDMGTCANGNCQSGALPIVLKSFDVVFVSDQVEISWITSSEFANDHFRLERSTNGRDWQVVATLPGSRESDENRKYSSTDLVHLPGVLFYRLIQIDLDGTEHLSAMSSVEIPGEKNIIYSSESRQLMQSISSPSASVIVLHDMMGRECHRTSLEPGENHQLPSNVIPGLYTLHVQMDRQIYSEKILVN